MNFEPSTILVISIVSVATLLRSAFGFADAVFAMPFLAGIIGLKTAPPLMAISSTILLKNWRDAPIKSAWRPVVSSLAGIPLSLWILKGTDDVPMKLFLAAVIIGVFSLIQTTQGITWRDYRCLNGPLSTRYPDELGKNGTAYLRSNKGEA